jgi:hypothetical protein
MTSVPEKLQCRTPHAGEWIRVHPGPEYRGEASLMRADDGTVLMLSDDMAQTLGRKHPDYGIERHLIFLTCNSDDVNFLWPVKLPVPEEHIAYRAMGEWVCFPLLQ